MIAEIEAKEITVGKLFSPEFRFKIPIYQRPLSWNKENFDQLFEDIFEAMSSNQPTYFLGSIILQEVGKDTYEIVDGQQRLTSLAILMAVIRDLTNINELKKNLQSYLFQEEDKYKEIPAERRIKPWEDLKEVFDHYVYNFEGTKKFLQDFSQSKIQFKDFEDPNYHLSEAINTFQAKINEKLKDQPRLENFVKYLLNKVVCVSIKTRGFASAYRLFLVLNSRGLPLDTCDLLKTENIGAIQDEELRLKYAGIWREIENTLGREELEKVISFIRTIKVKEKAKLSLYEEYKKNIFDKRLLTRGKEFIEYLRDICEIYQDKILDGKVLAKSSNVVNEYKYLLDIMRRFIPFSDWIPPLLVFYQKFKRDDLLLQFAKKLEKKAIIEWAADFSPTERITSFNRVIKFIESESNPQKLIDDFLFYKESGPNVRIINYKDKEQIKEILRNKLDSNIFYYYGKFAKYVLLRIDLTYWELENFPGYPEPNKITIEHILPENPSESSEWMKVFSQKEREEWTHKLGNLILLSGRKNSKAQNFDFNKKKVVYFKEKCTPFRITQLLEQKTKWTLEEIKERHYQLLDKAIEIFLDY